MDSPSTVSSVENQVSQVLARVPLLDVQRENGPLEAELWAAIGQVYRSGRFILGPECQQLEQSIATACDVRHAISCASGSDALLLALMALEIGPGDEVIVPSFTFFATASAVWRLGAKPVFVDIDPRTFNINPELMEGAISRATKAVIPVHLFGQPAELPAIADIARRRGLPIVEDAAQAILARHSQRAVGSLGAVGCFSFYPTKNLGGFGDGGMLTTNDDKLADQLRLLRTHGMRPRYYHQGVGINSRLDSIQAAVLNVKLPYLKHWTEARRRHARRYDLLLQAAGLGQYVTLPRTSRNCHHVWNQYTIRVRGGLRDPLRAFLASSGVDTEIYYPIPLHLQECFRSLDYGPGSLPETECASREVLSLPIFPSLTVPEQQTVVHQIAEFFQRAVRTGAGPNTSALSAVT